MNARAAHRQVRDDIPSPLAPPSARLARIGTAALPAALLSGGAIVFFVLWTFLLLILQSFSGKPYVFPVVGNRWLWLPALAAFAVGAGIAVIARHRPGPSTPRLLTLLLVILSGLVLVAAASQPVFVPVDLLHPLVVGAVVASVAAAPRLIHIRIDRATASVIVPVAWLLALSLGVSLWAFDGDIEESLQPNAGTIEPIPDPRGSGDDSEALINGLQALTNQLIGADLGLTTDSDQARRRMKQLASNILRVVPDDPAVWERAIKDRQERNLAQSVRKLAATLVASVQPNHVPRLSLVREPIAELANGYWAENEDVVRTSETISLFVATLAEGMKRLQLSIGDDAPTGLNKDLEGLQRELHSGLERIAASWTDGWSVENVLGKTDGRGLDLLFTLPLFQWDGTDYVLANLGRLMGLPRRTVEALIERTVPGCSRGADNAVFWLSCRSHAPADTGNGAQLKADVRIVYDKAAGPSATPKEIYLMIPVGRGESEVILKRRLMETFARVVGAQQNGVSGFLVIQGGQAIRVGAPFGRNYLDGRKRIDLRITRQ